MSADGFYNFMPTLYEENPKNVLLASINSLTMTLFRGLVPAFRKPPVTLKFVRKPPVFLKLFPKPTMYTNTGEQPMRVKECGLRNKF